MKQRILFFLPLLVLFSCSKSNTKKETALQPVKVFKVEQSVAYREKSFPAISKPNQVTTLSFRVGGPLKLFKAKPGQYYRKGDVIAMIDDRDFVIQQEKAKAVFAQSEAEYIRYKELIRADNVSKSAFDAVESKYLADRVNLTAATNAVSDTRLLAPFDGYIQEVYVEAHQDVKPTQGVVTFIDLNTLEIQTSVSSDIALRPETIISLEMEFDELPGKRLPIKLIDIARSSGNANLSYQLTAKVDNPKVKNNLIGGLTGTLYIRQNGKKILPQVPVTSVYNEKSRGTYVWVIKDKKVTRLKVKTGKLKNQNSIEIEAGLTGGELVVAAGGNKLHENQIIKALL
ncbi:efflux RND transporter periplasmic adaptor subunit [Marinilabiliaceae bacterium JC017]|nr:efflux RND transporter periplasmic adaptor subunit [Marinilabiliaceae bacterium JC017]